MPLSTEFSNLANNLRNMLLSIDNLHSHQERCVLVKQIFTNVLENKQIIINEIQSEKNIECRRSRFNRFLTVLHNKSYEIHNDMIHFYVGDAAGLQLCKNLERFVRLQMIRLLKYKPTTTNAFLESPYVRRSPRLNKENPVFYANPYETVQLRRSARLANKARV